MCVYRPAVSRNVITWDDDDDDDDDDDTYIPSTYFHTICRVVPFFCRPICRPENRKSCPSFGPSSARCSWPDWDVDFHPKSLGEMIQFLTNVFLTMS